MFQYKNVHLLFTRNESDLPCYENPEDNNENQASESLMNLTSSGSFKIEIEYTRCIYRNTYNTAASIIEPPTESGRVRYFSVVLLITVKRKSLQVTSQKYKNLFSHGNSVSPQVEMNCYECP